MKKSWQFSVRFFLLAAVFIVVFGAVYSQDDPLRVALVATQAAGDKGPIDGLIAGLEMAAEEFGVETQFLEALDPATYEVTLRNLARTGVDIVVSTFYGMGAASWLVAPDHPDTTFVVIVGLPSGEEQAGQCAVDGVSILRGCLCRWCLCRAHDGLETVGIYGWCALALRLGGTSTLSPMARVRSTRISRRRRCSSSPSRIR